MKFLAFSNYWNVIWRLAVNQWAVTIFARCPPAHVLWFIAFTHSEIFVAQVIRRELADRLAKSNVLQRSIPWHVHAHNLGYWKKCFTRTPGLRRNLFTTHWKKIAPQKHHVGILTSWLCDLSWFFTHIFFTHVMFSHFIFHDVRYTARKLKSLRFMAEHSTTQLIANYARLKYIYMYTCII